jgi:hypothetical protein
MHPGLLNLGSLEFPKSQALASLIRVIGSTAADAYPRLWARSATFRELKNSASSSCRGRTRRKKRTEQSGLVCDQTICARGGRRRTGRPPAPSLAAVLEGILVPDLLLAWPRPGIEHGKPQEAATGEVDDSRVAERSTRLGRSPPQAVDETPFDRNGASSRGGIMPETLAQFQEQESRLSAAATRRDRLTNTSGRGRPG